MSPVSLVRAVVGTLLSIGNVCTGISPATPVVAGISELTEVAALGVASTAGASA